ncbi:DUF6858 family protein [Sedimenticola selenatireducens]|jgi:hypothetical protein|uniref:Uncharacterized protein n=1 Tax=Sedimenticola selenatireducens TaxID=191960 RepID=A0A557S1B3_9GAMM|nr:hypothetical protein [Sedimenticola selenatireducens]TVO71211.1 hypothetical protein FHP88_14385 [Sedimenticola selenatireducens]TVT61513.1 MAG: hypothetical protein FHK78_17175 [Sedimenticola selenatireducens]
MKQTLLQEKYPILDLEIPKVETTLDSVGAIIGYLKNCIEAHPVARYIATFDHYDHTASLDDGEIAETILAAQNIVFCFGTKLPSAHVMAVRPRSIGVTEIADRFIISFMEAPMPMANQAMEEWVKTIPDKQDD